MDQKVALLLNIAAQKLVQLAGVARNHQIQGYPANDEFCELTKISALIKVLQNPLGLSLGDLEAIEEILRNIGDKGQPGYKPVVVQPSVEMKPKESCCDNQDIKNDIIDLNRQINYEKPWLKLTPVGLQEGSYEVGYGAVSIDVNWNANKIPLDLIVVDFPDDPSRSSPHLIGTHSGITLDLRAAEELVKLIDGQYNDREAYKGQHLLATDQLCIKTKWPCYWGKGPVDALDIASQINAFALGLNREISCPECIMAELEENEVLYFFYPHKGKAKQFVSDNGVINNSFKGTTAQFKTQSLITNGLPGDTVYGVIRSDQPGIGSLKVCVREVEWPVQQVEEPIVVPEDVITYQSSWSGIVCEKDDSTYEGIWSGSVCVKEDDGL